VTETVPFLSRSLAPVLYAAGLVPVIVGSIVVVSAIESTIGFDNFTTLRFNGDVAATASILVIGALVFGALDLVLVRLERLQTPALSDHLRHCAGLYVLLGTLVVILIATYETLAAHGVALSYGLAVMVLLTVGYAVSIDALILLSKRLRLAQGGPGDAT
jgi:Trk-type K+ transport system membrane component